MFILVARYRRSSIDLIKEKLSLNHFLPLIFVLIIFNTNLPLFAGKGSEALASLSITNKYQTWIGFVLLETTYLQFILLGSRSPTKKGTIFLLFVAFIIGSLSMSKAIAAAVLLKFITIRLFTNVKTPLLPVITGIVFSVFFIATVYYFTLSSAAGDGIKNITAGVDFFSILSTVWEIIYYSANFVYIMMLERGALEYADLYSHLNNHFIGLNYFLNPFIAPLGMGISQSIGPFINEILFATKGPRGVNPSLFFEFLYVYSAPIAVIFTPIVSVTILIIFYKIFDIAVRTKNTFDAALLMQIAFYLITFLSDSLFSIRSIFPLILILIVRRVISKCL